MRVHADAQCLLHHVCLICYSVLTITSLFNVRLQQLGNVWTPGHKLKCSRGSKLSDNFYMAQRVPRAWGVIHACLHGVSIAPAEDQTAEAGVLTGWCSALAEDVVTPWPEPVPSSHQSHDVALAWELHLSAGGSAWAPMVLPWSVWAMCSPHLWKS